MPRGFMPKHRHGAETSASTIPLQRRGLAIGVMSFLDRRETERALGRRLIGDISAGAMETLPYGLPLGRVHPGRRRRFFLISHVLMLLPSSYRYQLCLSRQLRACERSSASLSQFPVMAAASYVVWANASSVSSGMSAMRMASYGKINSRNVSW